MAQAKEHTATVKVGAVLDRSTVAQVVAELDRELQQKPERVTLDLGAVDRFDSAGLGGIVEGLRSAGARGVDVRLRGMSQPMVDFFSLLSVQRLCVPPAAAGRVDPISRVGLVVEPFLQALGAIAGSAWQTLRAVAVDPWRGKRIRFDRAVVELDACAAGALPIVALISFLLGLILAMQAYVQLRVWGAELYVADMVAVSVVSEIGPLMTAIILAARSASSNAAQLGAMVVGEEVDALRQMGIDPHRFLVVPKVLACAFAAIALGLVFDVVGMCGGALFAWSMAGISPEVYIGQTRLALHADDFAVAMLKSLAFGALVGNVGCALGMRVQGGSEGVGRATTNAVVLGIFQIIVCDALFVTAQRMVFA